MESIITFFCIIGLCIFVYGYIRMTQINKKQKTCNILYIPEMDDTEPNKLSYMEVLYHEYKYQNYV